MEFNMDMFRLNGKVALITGAIYGIRFEITHSLATAGTEVVFNNLNQESADEDIAHCKEAGIDTKDYVCDIVDEEAVQAMVQQIKGDAGSVNILVSSVGIIKRTPMIETDAADFRQVIDMDLDAPFIVSEAVIPDMTEKGGGKIISTYPMMSELGRETVSVYAAVRGGLKMLTKNVASEYGQYSIQCNGIGLGYIATSQTASLRETQENGERRPFDQSIIGRTSAARRGELIDLAGPSIFLASSASDSANGHVLYMDGGILAYIGEQP